MGWARNFASKTPLKKLNWSSTTGFSYKTLCIQPVQNPEKSRDFIFKNPGIFINLKSRDPGIPGIPLRPDPDIRRPAQKCCCLQVPASRQHLAVMPSCAVCRSTKTDLLSRKPMCDHVCFCANRLKIQTEKLWAGIDK